MKKFIALVLVLVMVLSLSTVAFADNGFRSAYALLNDVVNGVRYVVSHIFNTDYNDVDFTFTGTFGGLANAVIGYHNDVVNGITSAIRQMAESIPGRNCIAQRAACCVDCMATVFHYVYIIGVQD